MSLNPNKCANAVNSTMKRFGIKGRGVLSKVNYENTRVFVSISGLLSDDEMRFVSEQLRSTTNATVTPAKFSRNRKGFLFTKEPSLTDFPTKLTPKRNLPSNSGSPLSRSKGSDDEYWEGFKKTR